MKKTVSRLDKIGKIASYALTLIKGEDDGAEYMIIESDVIDGSVDLYIDSPSDREMIKRLAMEENGEGTKDAIEMMIKTLYKEAMPSIRELRDGVLYFVHKMYEEWGDDDGYRYEDIFEITYQITKVIPALDLERSEKR